MSVAGLLLRFAAVYIALMIIVAACFSIAGSKPNSGVNAGALIGAVYAVTFWFCNRNKRGLQPAERRSAIVGMWGIDTLLQVLFVLGLGALAGTRLPLGPMLLATVFIGLLHGAGIYFMVGFAGRQYEKQAARVAT